MYNYIYTCSERGLYAHRCTQYFVAAYGCMNISNMYTHIYVHKYTYHIYILFTQYFYLHIFIFILKCIYIVYLYAHIYIYRYGCACVCDYYFLLFFGMVLASPALLEQRSQEM